MAALARSPWARPGVLGVEAARAAAKKVLAKVALGEDPAAERREQRDKDRNTMRALVDDYLATKEPRLRPATLTEITRYLRGPYFKGLHSIGVDSVRRGDVSKHVAAIERESGSGTAREARRALGAFYSWAMTMGHADSNPVINSYRPAEVRPRERVLSNDELARVWKACDDGTEFGRVVRLLILTGCRRQEVGGMRWSEIDFERGTWTIPANRSKNHREHVLPLMPAMRSIIETCPCMVSRDCVFGARAAEGFTKWTLPKPDLDRRSGVTDWVLHDLRRSTATGLANLGTPPHIVEAALNHQSGSKRGVAGVYNRSSYSAEVKAALAMWHDLIRTLVAGGERRVLNFPAVS